MSAILMASTLVGCGQTADNASASVEVTNETYAAATNNGVQTVSQKAPKYIFLFIGDGMSYPQIQSASYYLGAKASQGGDVTGGEQLSFMNFPTVGSAQTFDSTSFCPDSASTATSISTGHKTYSGVINMDTTKTVKYTTISEQLRSQLGYKIGVLTTVNLNHATPAAFYAHQSSRKNYYEIGQEPIASNFDYFAGGGFLSPTGKNKDLESLYDVAKENGYTVTTTQSEIEAVNKSTGKVIAVDENLADGDAMNYDMDLADNKWELADYVQKGIEVLNNDKGFFMMVEGGKIDWACHANDAAADPTLVLTDYEVQKLKTAYERTLKVGASSQDKMTQEEYDLYGTYEPLSVTITHILNNKSGIAFSSYSHTGLPVPVFAVGNGSTLFDGYYDNTDIYNKITALTKVK